MLCAFAPVNWLAFVAVAFHAFTTIPASRYPKLVNLSST